jgi:hypothetical protein
VPRKDPGAQVAGALARKSGKAFEEAIDGVNVWYDRHGHAVIGKVNPPVSGWGSTLRVGASTVDYLGTRGRGITTTGVAFDAKSITGDATFKAPDAKAGKGRDRVRFFAQVDYLRGLRDRHSTSPVFCSTAPTSKPHGGAAAGTSTRSPRAPRSRCVQSGARAARPCRSSRTTCPPCRAA